MRRDQELDSLRAEIASLRLRLTHAIQDLQEYGAHVAPCPLSRQPDLFARHCTCGFSTAVKKELP